VACAASTSLGRHAVFEHLGSIATGLNFVRNGLETLRRGGIAVHTTELDCSSNRKTIDRGGTILFRRKDLNGLMRGLRQEGHKTEFTFQLGDGAIDSYIDLLPYSPDKHLKIKIGEHVSTSFGIAVIKGS
jgi:hypothetical protein